MCVLASLTRHTFGGPGRGNRFNHSSPALHLVAGIFGRSEQAWIVAGLLNKQIAGELGTCEATVKEQRAHVMAKMQAGSVAELVRFASRLEISPASSGSNPPKVG